MKQSSGCYVKIMETLVLVVVLLLGISFISCVADAIRETRAVNELSAVDPALGRELAAARSTSAEDADKVAKYAEANRANAEAERERAEARKAAAEAAAIERKLEVEKLGYYGLFMKEFGPTALLCVVGLLCAVAILSPIFTLWRITKTR